MNNIVDKCCVDVQSIPAVQRINTNAKTYPKYKRKLQERDRERTKNWYLRNSCDQIVTQDEIK